MNITNKNKDNIVIKFTDDEILTLDNSLNDVCNRRSIDDYIVKFSKSRENLLKLLEKISKDNIDTLALNVDELETLKRVLEDTYNEIDQWEFQTLIGIEREDILPLLQSIKQVLKG